MDLYAIIMAGGVGTRFWPLSRAAKPKQFLPIISERTMIEETVHRLLPLIPVQNITTVASAQQTKMIREYIPEIPEKNLIVEPRGKNTAPSLLLATAAITLRNPEAVCAVLPADHLIKNVPLFLRKLQAGAEAASREEALITFGIPPAFPATGYGYIQFDREDSRQMLGEKFYTVQQFKEKPAYEQAKSFVEAGNYAWNSGMFLWKASTFRRMLEECAPDWFPFWKKMCRGLEENDAAQIAAIFDEIPATSIDYALMEKAKGVLMCEGNFGWSDVGSWSALAEIWEMDRAKNSIRGEAIVLDSQGCLVYNPKKLTALVGVEDLIVVDTDDALLICRKDQDQKVKDVVAELKKKAKGDSL